jgi:hypothetical protein
MTTRMQQRRGTSTQWTAANPTLAAGEIGHETNTGKSKIGDGQTAWNSLVYYTTSADLASTTNTLTLGAASILSTHNSTTTNVHGISDTSSLAYLSQVNAAISTASTDATTKANAAQAAAATDATTKANAAEAAAATDATTKANAAQAAAATDATTKANAAQAAAAADATTKVAAVTKASLGLGVVDNVEDANKPVSTAQAAAIATAKSEAIAAAASAADTKISTHDVDTTNVHGISDTSVLATATTVATAKSEAITAAGTAADTKVSTAVAALTKSSVGLANVDNTADASKPVSTAQATAIATAKSEAIADATSRVTAVINGAPAAFDTLKEIADYIATDQTAASAVTSSLALKAPLASPTFTGTVTVAAAGVAFTDGTQTKAGVPSITNIPTALAAGARTIEASRADQFIPLTGAVEITLPATGYSTGQSIDFFQESGTGALFASTNSVVGTPGLKFRTTYSVATAMKTSSGWLVFGDLSA